MFRSPSKVRDMSELPTLALHQSSKTPVSFNHVTQLKNVAGPCPLANLYATTQTPQSVSADYMSRKTLRMRVVPKAGLEPARLAAGDFESPASTIPPLGHWRDN